MKLTVVVVGRVRGHLEPAVAEFERRAERYWKLEVVEVDAGPGKGDAPDAASVRRAEGTRIARRIPEEAERWSLSRTGRSLSSSGLAEELDARTTLGQSDIAFLIGGAFGLDDELLRSSHRMLCLSAMTFPHEIARLLLAEQLYRAGTILRNEPYHKGTA